jgi:hypothetical protein
VVKETKPPKPEKKPEPEVVEKVTFESIPASSKTSKSQKRYRDCLYKNLEAANTCNKKSCVKQLLNENSGCLKPKKDAH